MIQTTAVSPSALNIHVVPKRSCIQPSNAVIYITGRLPSEDSVAYFVEAAPRPMANNTTAGKRRVGDSDKKRVGTSTPRVKTMDVRAIMAMINGDKRQRRARTKVCPPASDAIDDPATDHAPNGTDDSIQHTPVTSATVFGFACQSGATADHKLFMAPEPIGEQTRTIVKSGIATFIIEKRSRPRSRRR